MGISHRKLTGWAPVNTHHHEYVEGVLVRTVVETEPEFDEQQYELAVALDLYEGTLNELGIPLDEAMSPDADPDNPNGSYRYVAAQPSRDWSIYAVEMEQRKPDWSGENYLRSRRFGVVRVERATTSRG